MREARTIQPLCFTDSLSSLFNRPIVLTQSSLPSFLSILAQFPKRSYKSRSIEYNFDWCWHHTLHLKKKTFPIFENLLKTSGTTTKVLSCLKIPLTSMRVDRLASCENIVPMFQTSSMVPPSPTPGLVPNFLGRNSSTASAKEFYYSFYSE